MSDPRRRSFASTSDISTGTLPSVTEHDNILPAWASEELECAICSKLLYEPVTTSCGHTYCRVCLTRSLDVSDKCPICRNILHLSHPLPITRVLHATISKLLPIQYSARAQELQQTEKLSISRTPLFPLSMVVFPRQSFVLHIFESRYRLMLRRVLAGSRQFGLLFSNSNIGCIVEVRRCVPLPDGRSYIETVARSRFRVLSDFEVDGYLVGSIEPYFDLPSNNSNTDELVARARNIIDSLLRRDSEPPISDVLQRLRDVPPIDAGPDALGLWLANLLIPDNLSERQRLLELRDSTARLAEMTELLVKYADKFSRDGNVAIESRQSRECVIS